MVEVFFDGLLTTVGIAFIIISQVLLYKCGDANYDEKKMFADVYAFCMVFGLALTIGAIGGYINCITNF